MDRLQGIEAFVRVAQTGSYAEAARLIGVAKSAVSTRVSSLEEQLGAPLFNRNTRCLSMSEAGKSFYEECVQLVGHSTELVERMRERSAGASGLLKVHALPGFALGHLGDVLGRFQANNPTIALEIVTGDAPVNPVREGYDCVLQIFEPVSEALVARRLFLWRGVFCAAPAYLARQGSPQLPAELARHRLGLYSRYPTRDQWTFERAGQTTSLSLQLQLRSNSVHLLRDFAREGHGIVFIPTFLAVDDLLAGRLKVVMPNYGVPALWLHAVFPAEQRGRLKLRLFLDALGADPYDDPPWDKQMIDAGLLGSTATPTSSPSTAPRVPCHEPS